MTDNDLLLKLANMIDHGQAGDMWDMNDVSEGDHARLPGLIRTLAQTEQQAALAWHCCDERYPWIQGIVTTSEITLDAWRDSGIKYQPLYPRAAQPPAAPVDLALLNEREIIRAEAEHSRSSAAAPVETEARDGAKRPDAPQWERRWPHDQPNGWNLHADQFLSLVNSAEGMMWLALGRAKYLELRVDTRDCGFNLYDRDGHPLNPDEVVEAVEKVKRDYGVGAEPHSRSSAENDDAPNLQRYVAELSLNGRYVWCIVEAIPRKEWVVEQFGCGPDAQKAAYDKLTEAPAPQDRDQLSQIDFMLADGWPNDSVAQPQGASVRDEMIEHQARFLLDRLQEFDPGDFQAERDFHGHVAPAISRLKSALAMTRPELGSGK